MPDNNPISRLQGEKLVFEFGGTKYEVFPEKDLAIDDDNLSDEFSKQPSHYAYVAILVSKADSVVKMCKIELEEAQAKIYDAVRTAFEMEHKKATEATIESKVAINPDVMTCKRKLLKAQEDYSLLKSMEDAFRTRTDMLIQIGLRQRIEIENGELTIKSRKPSKEPGELMKAALAKATNGDKSKEE